MAKKLQIRKCELSCKMVQVLETYRNVIDYRLQGTSDAYDIAKLLRLDKKIKEHFYIMCLNAKLDVIGVHEISIGELTCSSCHPREVFTAALMNGRIAAIICMHNHPSGDPTPSSEDLSVTSRLAQAGNLLGIQVFNHIIIGDDRYFSLKENGYM